MLVTYSGLGSLTVTPGQIRTATLRVARNNRPRWTGYLLATVGHAGYRHPCATSPARQSLTAVSWRSARCGRHGQLSVGPNGGLPVAPDCIGIPAPRVVLRLEGDIGQFGAVEVTLPVFGSGKAWLLHGGADLQVVKERLGHASIATTKRYLHSLPTADETALDALSRIRQPQAARPA
jgi:hypothetical protein